MNNRFILKRISCSAYYNLNDFSEECIKKFNLNEPYLSSLCNRLGLLGEHMTTVFINCLEKYRVEYGSLICFTFSGQITPLRLILGDYIARMGIIGGYFDFEEFLYLDEKNKKIKLLTTIYEWLTQFAQKFNHPVEPLKQALQKSQLLDFYLPYYTGKPNMKYNYNKQNGCLVERKLNLETEEFRLLLKERNKGEFRMDLLKKEIFIIAENPKMDPQKANKLAWLKIIGWNGDYFEVINNNDLYRFNTKDKTLTKENVMQY